MRNRQPQPATAPQFILIHSHGNGNLACISTTLSALYAATVTFNLLTQSLQSVRHSSMSDAGESVEEQAQPLQQRPSSAERDNADQPESRDEQLPRDHDNSTPPHSTTHARAPSRKDHKAAAGAAEDDTAAASEESKAAAAAAEASVKGDSAIPEAPIGLNVGLSHTLGETLMGLGTAPVVEDVPVVSVPRLDDLICKHLADHYHLCPAFDWIPREYLPNVINLLEVGHLDFATSAALIQTELYWEKLCRARWPAPTSPDAIGANSNSGGGFSNTQTLALTVNVPSRNQQGVEQINLAKHGHSWKRCYCERHMQECLEKYHHSKNQQNYHRLVKELEACKPFVHSVVLRELMSHLDLSDLLYDFPHLEAMDIRFGARQVGMDFDKSLFGMSLNDAFNMSRLLASTESLTTLVLSENLIGDEAVLLLLSGLGIGNGKGTSTSLTCHNRTLTHLDLSHNRIGDIGARHLAALLDGGISLATNAAAANVRMSNNNSGGGNDASDAYGSVLSTLILNDNRITSKGARSFASALLNNRGLAHLDLSLNSLGEVGGSALFHSLAQHPTLRCLKLSAADLESEAYQALNQLLRSNRSVEELYLSANQLVPSSNDRSSNSNGAMGDGGAALLESLQDNDHVIVCDLRRCGLSNQVENDVRALLTKRTALQKQSNRKAVQKDGWDGAL